MDEIKEDYHKQRLDICRSCDKKIQAPFFELCSLCGCVILFKTKLKNQRCPINKWVEVNDW